jgi:hypothetical protein
MTTLVAIQGDGWSVIGCDSRSSDESGRYLEMATHKVVENNGILIAGSGAGRGSNILQFGWRAPKPKPGQDLDVFMTKTFIPSMRKVFIESGYDMKADGEAAAHDSEFIISALPLCCRPHQHSCSEMLGLLRHQRVACLAGDLVFAGRPI